MKDESHSKPETVTDVLPLALLLRRARRRRRFVHLAKGAMGGTVALLALFGVPWLAWHLLTSNGVANKTAYYTPLWGALFLAVITPFAIISIRTQVRYTRVRLIDLFAENFGLKPADRKGEALVSFEFVRGKYFIDLPKATPMSSAAMIPRFPMLLHADWMLLFCAVPYMVFSTFGLFVLLSPLEFHGLNGPIADWFRPSLLAVGGVPASVASDSVALVAYQVNVQTVAAMAFAGGYFFTLRLFLRAVVMFDLSTVTFLRAFAHMVLAATLAIALYRLAPTIEGLRSLLNPVLPDDWLIATPYDPKDGLSSIWLGLAFLLGFTPDAALDQLRRLTGLIFKRPRLSLQRHANTVPLTVIDGIDHWIGFRLEEANIHDVQNLATINPIMLHIESPHGIYQTMDWVGQAQLCTVVGPDRFLALRSLHLRTIFDLENAVLKGQSDALKDAIADILFQDGAHFSELRTDASFARPSSLAALPADPVGLQARREALTEVVRQMIDDLHVFRLRQLWKHIENKLATTG